MTRLVQPGDPGYEGVREGFDLEEREVTTEHNWAFFPPALFKLEGVELTGDDPRVRTHLDVFQVCVHHVALGRWGKHVPLATPETCILVTIGLVGPWAVGDAPIKAGVRLTGLVYRRA